MSFTTSPATTTATADIRPGTGRWRSPIPDPGRRGPGSALTDTAIMLRRYLLRMRRYPSLTLLLVGMPVIFLLLFVYVFGATLGAGLPGAGGSGPATGRAGYLAYVTPAILLLTLSACVQGTAISVAMDRTTGIVARFRTMAISPGSILAGHVIGSVLQAMLGMALLLAVSVLLGYRPHAGFLDWLALAGLLTLATFALTWLSVGLGLQAKSVETASNTPMILMLLPFLGSGFVPVASMPAGVRWFAEYQPFTPIIETVRALLGGTALSAGTVIMALGWCVVITVGGYLWSRSLFSRERT